LPQHNDSGKTKPKINIITKDPSRKHIIVSMGNDDKSKSITSSNPYITNINSMLRNIKSDIMADLF